MTFSKNGKFRLEVVRKPKPQDLSQNKTPMDRNSTHSDRIGPIDESIFNSVKLWDPELKR